MLLFYVCCFVYFFFFSSRRRHTRCALVTGVQTCALPIYLATLAKEHAEIVLDGRIGRIQRKRAAILDLCLFRLAAATDARRRSRRHHGRRPRDRTSVV